MTAERNVNGADRAGMVLADRYRLETQVAAGGMGEVWRATDMLLERTVAVKLLRESLAEDAVVSERFRREALTAANLSHPNMADVFDYVQANGRPGIVMEYVDGETLAERITREGPLGVEEAARIVTALLAALQAAHDAGIVHRDVKPGNVMLTPAGGVKVTDFGIARAIGSDTITETGMIIGTAHYLSPEQVTGKPATPASDLYAVGAILYEMLTAKRPFEAETPIAVAMRRLAEDPAAPTSHRPDLPDAVARVVLRALARDPASRFASADAMRDALETAVAGTGALPAPPPRVDPTPTEVLPVVEDADATVIRPASSAVAEVVAERRRRDYRRGIVWAIGLAAVVTALVLLVMALAGGPDLVAVPNFVGRDIAAARAEARELGLKIETISRSSARPRGEVVGQGIDARTTVGTGTTLRLAISTGIPPCCRVPDLRGRTRGEAERALEDAKLKLGEVREQTTAAAPDGRVIAQSVDVGDIIREGSEVDIVIAKEPDRGKGNKDQGKGNEG